MRGDFKKELLLKGEQYPEVSFQITTRWNSRKIIFLINVLSNQTATSDWLSMFLEEGGVNCVNLNKAMLTKIRETQLAKFQQGIVQVLSCTDVASRGLDTTRVSTE